MVLVSRLDSAQNFLQPALADDSQWVLTRLQPPRCCIFNFTASALLTKKKGGGKSAIGQPIFRIPDLSYFDTLDLWLGSVTYS